MTVPKRFGVLRLIGTALKVIAWIVLIIAILAAIGMAVAGSTVDLSTVEGLADNAALAGLMQTAGGIAIGVTALLVGILYFLVIYAYGDFIHMQLAIEENTRLTAALLLKMHQDSQIEEPAPYGAGFANEPFNEPFDG